MIYKNKKTGNLYRHLASGIDATNERDGLLVVVYCPCDNEHSIYVRADTEFHQKFELVENP